MYNIENGNFNFFLEKISEKLGFKIDNSSFDYDILKSLFDINVSFKKEYEKLLDKVIFENLKGKDLDNFLSFFNIIRKRNNNDELYTLVLKFNVNNNSFIIKEGCIINIDNKSYKNIKTTSINNEKELLTVQRISKQDIIKQIIGNNGSIILDENYVSVNTGNINDVSSNLLFLGFNINNVEQETDFEFLERAKNILQSYGYNNKEKIKFELLKDERIKNIKIKENEETKNLLDEEKLYQIPITYYNVSDLKITKEIEQKFVPMKEKKKIEEIEKSKGQGIGRLIWKVKNALFVEK